MTLPRITPSTSGWRSLSFAVISRAMRVTSSATQAAEQTSSAVSRMRHASCGVAFIAPPAPSTLRPPAPGLQVVLKLGADLGMLEREGDVRFQIVELRAAVIADAFEFV